MKRLSSVRSLKIKIIVKLRGPNDILNCLYTHAVQSIVYMAKTKEIETIA